MSNGIGSSRILIQWVKFVLRQFIHVFLGTLKFIYSIILG